MAPRNTEPVLFQDKDLNLNDKEIWLVQVPPDFDAAKAHIKSEQEVEYEGSSYSLLTNGTRLPDCHILVAPNNDSKLLSTSVKPRGVLSLTKKVSLPKIDYEKARTPRPTVPQKRNLRMRHYPTGYGPESFGIQEDTTLGSETPLAGDSKRRKVKQAKPDGVHKSKEKKSKDKKEKKSKKEKKD